MTKIVFRALGVAAVAGACTLTAAVPASADIIHVDSLVTMEHVAQNVGVDNGPLQSTSNHDSNNRKTAQQGITENEDNEIVKDIPIANDIVGIL